MSSKAPIIDLSKTLLFPNVHRPLKSQMNKPQSMAKFIQNINYETVINSLRRELQVSHLEREVEMSLTRDPMFRSYSIMSVEQSHLTRVLSAH